MSIRYAPYKAAEHVLDADEYLIQLPYVAELWATAALSSGECDAER
jgi:hypothetical protein